MRAPLALMVGWAAVVGSAGAAETWIEVKSPNFTVVSNAGEGTARRTANEFEQIGSAYTRVWPWAHVGQTRPMVVIALKNEASLRRWAPAYYETKGGIDVVSGSAYGADRVYLLLRTDYRPEDAQVAPAYNVYRAYVELLLASSIERRLPVWLSSGLGEVLGNTIVYGKEIQVGKPVPWELRRFNEGGRQSLRTILDARADSPLLNKEDQRSIFDAQCYVLVHYLLFGDKGAHSVSLNQFLRLWMAGRSHDQAFAEAFGDVNALEAQVSTYATRSLLSYARFESDAKLESSKWQPRTLPPAEVSGLQASVHVAMRRPVEAQAAIREARTEDSRSPFSYDAEGLLADLDQDNPRAKQAYAQAVELSSTSAYSHYRAAQLSWKANADKEALGALRQRLERAVELNPSYVNSYSFLAEVLVDLGEPQAALAAAQRAVALEPGQSYHRVALARVLHSLGRDDDAQKSAELGLQLANDSSERSNAERFLLFLQENLRYAQERKQRETSQKLTDACQTGEATACAQILPELEKGCEAKQAGACSYLSWLYSQGTGVARDDGKALGYLERACEIGDKHACVEHAWKLIRGEGARKDEPAGVSALQALCDSGFYPGCTRLAVFEAARPSAAARARAKGLLARACDGGEQDACSMAKQLK
jgi:TPR repeat protein